MCLEAAQGNLEARIIGIDPTGETAGTLLAINRMLDLTDAFIREACASLEYASHDKFFRKFMLQGMPGVFRNGAEIINSASEAMEASSPAFSSSTGFASPFSRARRS